MTTRMTERALQLKQSATIARSVGVVTIALGFILVSALLPYLFFRRRGWL